MSAPDQEAKNPDSQELSLLLEIGTEEIPARFLPAAVDDLKSIAAAVFAEYRITHREMKSCATPRRLVLMMKGVAPTQNDAVREVFGPSKKVAYDDQGTPTKAATGFAASLGISVSELVIKTKGKGEYVAAVISERGAETKSALPEIFRKIILSLRFPKSMRWGNGNMLFVRPIHWIVALCGQETVHVEIDGIRSGNITRGHRFLSPASFQIKEVSAYMNLLENNFVILDQEKRERMIRSGIDELAAKAGGRPVADDGLLETVNFLVEYPAPVLCGFDGDYLKLPKELLITVMKDHQKYFGIEDEDGNLQNSFIVISNTRTENSEAVRTGAERVIKARFDDAKFYFQDDRKKRLIDRVDELKNVTFHDRLGSLLAKTERIVAIASFFADRLAPDRKEDLLRAARLAKGDLITGVVREFPELQGIMGKYYAMHDEEDKGVSQALEEQYLPKSFGGRLPETDLGALLSLSDKIDNIASFFSIGLMPTGSEDPFALRRQAMGIVSIMIDRGYGLSLETIFERAIQEVPVRTGQSVSTGILDFMAQRLEFVLSSKEYAQDLVKAVLPLSRHCSLKAVMGRIEALKRFREEEIYPSFLLAIKRVNNIIPKTALPPLRVDLLVQEEEKNLYSKFAEVSERMTAYAEQEKFPECFAVFSGITLQVNSFFDKVLVMDKQEDIKLNRLALLKEIWAAASQLADFSKLS